MRQEARHDAPHDGDARQGRDQQEEPRHRLRQPLRGVQRSVRAQVDAGHDDAQGKGTDETDDGNDGHVSCPNQHFYIVKNPLSCSLTGFSAAYLRAKCLREWETWTGENRRESRDIRLLKREGDSNPGKQRTGN